MDKANTRISPFLKQCFVALTVGINLIGQGSFAGYPAILLPQLHLPDSDVLSNKTMDSWITSSMAITLLIGGAMVPGIIERFGRKIMHYIVCIFAAVGWTVTILATSVEVILFARIISGLSFGMMFTLRSIILGEYTSPKNRGGFLTTLSFTQGFGIFFVHLIGSLLSWRKTAFVCLILPLISLIMTFFLPESPSWLVSKRRFDESRQTFLWLRGDDEEHEIEAMIKAKMELDHGTENKKVDIIGNIRKPEFYKPIVLMLHVYILPQFSGATVIATYSTTIIKLIMNPEVNADLLMVLLDIERILGNILAIFVINKVKRRTMVAATVGLCIFSLLAQASYVYSKKYGILTEDILWLPGILMIMHFLSIALGTIPLPTVIAGEVFPLQYRSISGTISMVSMSANMFITLKTFQPMVEGIGISGTYVVYAFILIYCLIMMMIMMPETHGRTLQDIEDEFRGKLVLKDMEEMQSLNICNIEKSNESNN